MKDAKKLISEIKKKLNTVRQDDAFKGVLTFSYPNEILQIEKLLIDLENTIND